MAPVEKKTQVSKTNKGGGAATGKAATGGAATGGAAATGKAATGGNPKFVIAPKD